MAVENVNPDEELKAIELSGQGHLTMSEDMAVKGIKTFGKFKEFEMQVVKSQRDSVKDRMTPTQWLDENEMEWTHLDNMLRSRPWAKNKDTPFAYPFRKVTEEMKKSEGAWPYDEKTLAPDVSRFESECEVLTHVRPTKYYPPGHRVVLFTPEFGSVKSYDLDVWNNLGPPDDCDVWVCSWQGYASVDEMYPQILRKLLSFADAVSTVWFGHSAGALVAYEMLKLMESRETPNLPAALVVSGCPAPHLFSKKYKPTSEHPWLSEYNHRSDFEKLKLEEAKILRQEFAMGVSGTLTPEQRMRILGDKRIISKYKHKHADKQVLQPIMAIWNEGDSLVDEASMKAWSDCSAPGFEFVNVSKLNSKCFQMGHGFARLPVPELVKKVEEWSVKHKRTKDIEVILKEERCDVGPTDGPVPESVDWCVIGAGTAGTHATAYAHKEGFTCLNLERSNGVGGIWNYYANKYSQVNTSEIGYRMVHHKSKGALPNKDHSPKHDILRDLHIIAAQAKGCYRCNKDVKKCEKQPDGTYIIYGVDTITGKPFEVKSRGVCFATNRRIGKRRDVPYLNEDKFFGEIRYGYANEVLGLDFWGKRVIVVGAGAFAFENLRTSLEHGAKHATILGRRSGTTCPKWIDIIAFIRPQDEFYGNNKIGNALSFEVWKACYDSAGLMTPECWDEGLLKPNNHTVSVSDLAFIGGNHGMTELLVGEIKQFHPHGHHVILKDDRNLEVDIVIKATGFFLNEEVAVMTGHETMYPWGNVDFNLFYQAEPLLDGAQFGSAKGSGGPNGLVEDARVVQSREEAISRYWRGLKKFNELGLPDIITPRGNPFGSGYVGGMQNSTLSMIHLFKEQEEQKNVLECAGPPVIKMSRLWASAIGSGQGIINDRLLRGLLQEFPK